MGWDGRPGHEKPWSIFAFREDLDPGRLASDCAAWGLDQVILAPAQLADGRLAAALRTHGLGLWANLPVFHAPAFLQDHPEHYARTAAGAPAIHGWLHMACPSSEAFLEARLALFAETLRRCEPATVSLDFIRFFVYWEGVALDGDPRAIDDGCFCARCLGAARRFAGERLVRDEAGRIAPPSWPAWEAWKQATITASAARVAAVAREGAPHAPLFVKTVPWGADELGRALGRVAGQDLLALARLCDGVIPMAFAHLLRRDAAWKEAHLRAVERATGREVPSYVQMDAIGEGSIPAAEMEAELAAAVRDGRAPIVYHYEPLASDPARAALLQRWASAPRSERGVPG